MITLILPLIGAMTLVQVATITILATLIMEIVVVHQEIAEVAWLCHILMHTLMSAMSTLIYNKQLRLVFMVIMIQTICIMRLAIATH